MKNKIYLFFSTLSLFANTPSNCCQEGVIDHPSTLCQQYQGHEASLYSAIPCTCDPCDGFLKEIFDVSFLVWQAQEDGLQFALHNHPKFSQTYGTGAIPNDISGDFIRPDFRWTPAVKVNVGVNFTNNWETNFLWTFFYSQNSKATTVTADSQGKGLFPIWSFPSMPLVSTSLATAPFFYQHAKAAWTLHFNTIDWEIGYPFALTKSLSLRFFGGVKGLSIRQQFHVSYANGVAIPAINPSAEAISSNTRIKNTCLGMGPRIGFHSKWFFTKEWSLIANVAGAMPLYSFTLKRHDTGSFLSNTSATQDIELSQRNSFWAFRPNIEYASGIAWDTCFGKNKQYFFGCDALYEIQHFWEQNMMFLIAGSPMYYLPFYQKGNLTLQGVSINLRFGY